MQRCCFPLLLVGFCQCRARLVYNIGTSTYLYRKVSMLYSGLKGREIEQSQAHEILDLMPRQCHRIGSSVHGRRWPNQQVARLLVCLLSYIKIQFSKEEVNYRSCGTRAVQERMTSLTSDTNWRETSDTFMIDRSFIIASCVTPFAPCLFLRNLLKYLLQSC